MTQKRRFPIGAEPLSGGGAIFRVWAPGAKQVAVELLKGDRRPATLTALEAEGTGYFSGEVPAAAAGARYRLRLPHGSYPDPASRFQPEGPHGPSQICDPAFPWTDQRWEGYPPTELVIYELHLGTFTRDGTWRAATEELAQLAKLGITAVEIMPIAEFPGGFGWGYDGVDLFAPSHLYGTPADVRAFVNRAHELEIAVILDVVYNHLGPDGCYLQEFSPAYFTAKYQCEWGKALNFDGKDSAPVREFFVSNARYWIEDFHFDGLRLDATQQIFDDSPTHVLAEIVTAVRAAAGHRLTFVVGENEPQHTRLVRPQEQGGYGLDALWNDDFHHAAMVAATGRREAYFIDYGGTPQEFISSAKYGFLFQGQWYRWQQQRRGTPALLSPGRNFVIYLQNHDQVANSLAGRRISQLASPAMFRAVTALLLLSPSIPLLFQGQEFGASAPFLFFADHNPKLAPVVAEGRKRFLSQFRTIAAEEAQARLPSSGAPEVFQSCKLDFAERETHADVYRLHADLLRLRRECPVFRRPERVDGAVLGAQAFVLRFFDRTAGDRLLVVNLGGDLTLTSAPEPLLAPIEDHGWSVAWSSESPVYGGGGTPALETKAGWVVLGPGAFVLSPHPNRELPNAKTSQED